MLDKDKAIKIAATLIHHPQSILNTKYSKSHEKVAIIYKEHIIELLSGDEKFIKYCEVKLPLSKKEYKELYDLFSLEVKSRKEASDSKKFEELENDLI